MNPVDALRAARHDDERVVLEGLHALKHAARFGAEIEHVLVGDAAAFERLVDALAPDLPARLPSPPASCTPAQWQTVAPARLPSPVLAVARRPRLTPDDVLATDGPVVLLDRPRHLGNLGAAIRVAAAAGAAGLVTLGGGDPWHATAVRGAAGLQFALPVASAHDLPDPSPRRLVAIDPAGDPLGHHRMGREVLLAFGSERDGLRPELTAAATACLAIPMRAGVSSLNLATAVAVTLYAGGWASSAT